jgi:hypothetical protein
LVIYREKFTRIAIQVCINRYAPELRLQVLACTVPGKGLSLHWHLQREAPGPYPVRTIAKSRITGVSLGTGIITGK